MKELFKTLIRNTLTKLGLDITRNLKYDRLTKKIIASEVSQGDICVDVGAHKGEILDLLLASSAAAHYAFEPIPFYYNYLKDKYGAKCNIYNVALSEHAGETTFNFVKNAPAYSGLKKRQYNIAEPDIEEITVKLSTLDQVINPKEQIKLIKIDVEGAELGVLKGAVELIKRCKPIIIFECGLGASEYYETTPKEIYDFIVIKCSLQIFTLHAFTSNKQRLTENEFISIFQSNAEYYFVAAKV
ncbi:MAG: hypothetical protein RIQ89_1671 [Bacteroidota bacterium]|jgi:FkbM family methyltransferase